MSAYRIEAKDFLTCWKALSHSERIFQNALSDPTYDERVAPRDEIRAYLEEIREVKAKISVITGIGGQPTPESTDGKVH